MVWETLSGYDRAGRTTNERLLLHPLSLGEIPLDIFRTQINTNLPPNNPSTFRTSMQHLFRARRPTRTGGLCRRLPPTHRCRRRASTGASACAYCWMLHCRTYSWYGKLSIETELRLIPRRGRTVVPQEPKKYRSVNFKWTSSNTSVAKP